MPSLTLFPTQDTLSATNTVTGDWNTLRDGGNVQINNHGITSSPAAVAAVKQISGRTIIYGINRAFFEFDTSSITHIPKNASLSIKGIDYGNADMACCRGYWSSAPYWGGIDGYSHGGSDGSGAGDQSSNIIYYANTITSWSTSGYNNITLRQQALVDIAGNTEFKVALLEATHDLLDIEPTYPGDTDNKSGLITVDAAGTISDPKLKLTTQDDSVFFGANF